MKLKDLRDAFRCGLELKPYRPWKVRPLITDPDGQGAEKSPGVFVAVDITRKAEEIEADLYDLAGAKAGWPISSGVSCKYQDGEWEFFITDGQMPKIMLERDASNDRTGKAAFLIPRYRSEA